jgi:hypothetical protein
VAAHVVGMAMATYRNTPGIPVHHHEINEKKIDLTMPTTELYLQLATEYPTAA